MHGLALLGLLVLVAPVLSAEPAPEGPQVVEGVGAIVQHNQAAAREKALQYALRKALEQAVAELVEAFVLVDERQVLESRLYARTPDYIRSYRILWEYPDTFQKVYRIGIEADIAADEVAQTVRELGLSPGGGAMPGDQVLVLIVEQRLEHTYVNAFGRDSNAVSHLLHAQLREHGFRMVSLDTEPPWDGREESALAAGRRADAAVVLVGYAQVAHVTRGVIGMPVHTLRAVVQVQALRTATGYRVAQEHGEATVLHADVVVGSAQALGQAATEVARRLLPPLLAMQQESRQYSHPLYGEPR